MKTKNIVSIDEKIKNLYKLDGNELKELLKYAEQEIKEWVLFIDNCKRRLKGLGK